jgi:hypothetical protein
VPSEYKCRAHQRVYITRNVILLYLIQSVSVICDQIVVVELDGRCTSSFTGTVGSLSILSYPIRIRVLILAIVRTYSHAAILSGRMYT